MKLERLIRTKMRTGDDKADGSEDKQHMSFLRIPVVP